MKIFACDRDLVVGEQNFKRCEKLALKIFAANDGESVAGKNFERTTVTIGKALQAFQRGTADGRLSSASQMNPEPTRQHWS